MGERETRDRSETRVGFSELSLQVSLEKVREKVRECVRESTDDWERQTNAMVVLTNKLTVHRVDTLTVSERVAKGAEGADMRVTREQSV